MGAGGDMKGRPGMGGQPMGRPMTPFSMDAGMQGSGMRGANTGMGFGGGAGNLGQMASMLQGGGQMQQAPGYGGGMGGFTQSGAMSGGFDPSQLSRMSNMIQGGGQMPSMATPYSGGQQMPINIMPPGFAPFQQSQGQVPQSMLPFQQSQGVAPQAPTTQNPMQQGLGGLGAYMGGGAGGGGA